MNRNKVMALAGALTIISALSFSCVRGKSETAEGFSGDYSFGGSTTVEPLALAAIEELTELHPSLNVSYDSTGSSTGVKGILSGIYSLAGASRELKSGETAEGASAIPVALDGVAVVVNKATVPLENFSLEDLGRIYAGEITNWADLGGPDAPIAVYNRDEASGTRDCFKMVVKAVGAKFVRDAAVVTSNGDMVSKVGTTPYSIGYCGFGYINALPQIRPVKIDGVDPEEAAVVSGDYRLSRKLNLCHTGELTEGSFERAFIDFLLSEDGQQIVVEEKFIPIVQ